MYPSIHVSGYIKKKWYPLIPTWTETRGPISTAIATRADYQVRWVQSLSNWVDIPIARTPENTVADLIIFRWFWTLKTKPDLNSNSGSRFPWDLNYVEFWPKVYIIWTQQSRNSLTWLTKGGLISDLFLVWLKSPKMGAKSRPWASSL